MQYAISSPPKPKVTVRTPTQGKRIKILTTKQMLQRLPEALAQVKAGNTSDYLLNKKTNCLFFVSSKRLPNY